jgi:hypothetical protein
MILIIGDSNFRNVLDTHGEALSATIKEKITFLMNTSNESLKTELGKLAAPLPKIIIVSAPLNEIVQKAKQAPKKGRADIIKAVVEEQNKIVNISAKADGRLGIIHLLIPPFLRSEPTWMEDKWKMCLFYMRDAITGHSPCNVGIGNPPDITKEDLIGDGVHLSASGMEKLYKVLETDIKNCKENLGEGEGELTQDWASQIATPAKIPRTPGNLKRTRIVEEDESTDEDEDVEPEKKKKTRKKSKTSEDKMDKLIALVSEMKEENKLSRAEVIDLKTLAGNTDKKVDDLKVEVDGLKDVVERETVLTAEMREDIDGLENENLKTMVIVRKLKAKKTVPKDKKLLRTYIQDLARTLVTAVCKSQEAARGVKYATALYAFVDPTKKDNKEGLVPPFKICFNVKDQAVAFRDKAVKMAKMGAPQRTYGADQEGQAEQMEQETWDEVTNPQSGNTQEENICQGAYFTFYQTAATRFRTTLMWSIADALKTKSKQVWVNQSNKPTLQIKEAGKVKSLTFVQAMAEYKEKINQKTLEEVKKAAVKIYAGNLEKTFIVIKD